MIPSTRRIRPNLEEIQKRNPDKAGVMALFYAGSKKTTMVMLILRKTSHGVHSGQMGLPGGRVELRDKNIEETAIRETYEEIGVRTSNIISLKELSRVYIPPSNFWVYPFIGIAKGAVKFIRQESEVEELVPVKLEELMDDANLVRVNRMDETGTEVEVPAFSFNDKIVWGATAMMLNEVKYLLRQIL